MKIRLLRKVLLVSFSLSSFALAEINVEKIHAESASTQSSTSTPNFNSLVLEPVLAHDYADFLNHAAVSDPHFFYEEKMGTDSQVACIRRSGVAGSYHYEVIAGRENFPVRYVSDFNKEVYSSELNQPTTDNQQPTTAFLSSNQNDFEIDAAATSTLTLAAAPISHRPSSNNWSEIFGVLGMVGIAGFGHELMMTPADDNLSNEEERVRTIGAKEEEKGDYELSNRDSADDSEEVAGSTSIQLSNFRAALATYPEADQFIIVEENGNLVFKTPRSSSYYDQWKRLETLNFLRMALRQEYGKRARTIVVDVIGASNLTNDNHLSAPRLREILERADNNTAFFDSDIHYLEPILVTQLEGLLDNVACADWKKDSSAKESQKLARQQLRNWLKKAETHAGRREQSRASAITYSQAYDTIAHPVRESDEKWRFLYNATSKSAVKSYPSVDWSQVANEKREFKRSYNRARRTMSDFSSEFPKVIVYLKGDEDASHILNLKTIRELAESSRKVLDEHWERISNAYIALSSEAILKHNEFQHSIRNIATLWNEAAIQAQFAEHLWNMGAKYATYVRLSEILKRAERTPDARYNLGHITSKEAAFLCESFVGPDFTEDVTDKDGIRLISTDKLKQSRFPEYKHPSDFTGWFGCRMANLQKKLENGSWTNGHLTVSDIYFYYRPNYDPDDHYVLSSDDESE